MRTPHAPFIRSHGHDPRGHDPRGPNADATGDRRDRDIARARAMRARGESLYAIAVATGRSKEWLRTYAGISG